jgi:type IV pilus assembly protein PilN
VYLTSINQSGQTVAIKGIAQTNERVSELLRNTFYNSPWLEKPELIEIKATNQGAGRDARRLFEFSMRVSIKRPQPAAATPAAAPVATPAAAAAKSS